MTERHRLRANQLQLNEPLPWDVYDRAGQLLLRKGYVIQRDTQIERLIESGMFVDATMFRAQSEHASVAIKKAFDPQAIWREVQAALGALCIELPRDGSLPERVLPLARSVIELCAKCPDLALAAITLIEFRRYAFAHSLHVAVLCELIARKGDFDEDSRLSLCCAALTENIAMCEQQQMLFHQKNAPTTEQRQAILDHPMSGARLLQACGVKDPEWLRAVLEHHETMEGTGYPRHVKNPSLLASLIHTCDVYAAKITGRTYRKPMSAPDAAKSLYLEMAQGKDNPFAGLLIKEFGMYLPGTFVRLANGEVGVVRARNAEQSTAPQVAVIISAKGLRHTDPVRRQTASAPEFKIVAVLPRDNSMMTVNFEQIWCR